MAGNIHRPNDDWDPESLFYKSPLHREPDHETSIQGARDVKSREIKGLRVAFFDCQAVEGRQQAGRERTAGERQTEATVLGHGDA